MQFAGEFIVQGLPVAVMWSTAVGMYAYNAMRPFLFLCVWVGVLFTIFCVAIECFSMNKVDYNDMLTPKTLP